MKKKNINNNYVKKNNYSWEPTYKIKKNHNGYNVDKRTETTSSIKIVSAIIAIVLILTMLIVVYYFYKDNELMKTIFEVADSYIFIGLTIFVIFLVFKTNKKEYNKNKKGVK